MNLEGYEPAPVDPADLPVEDRWILEPAGARPPAAATADLEAFQFAEATRRLRDFTWNDFCDWYVEFVKGRLRDPEPAPVAQRVLAAVLDGLCRLLHPIMPFVTEQVWQALDQVAPRRGLPDARARRRERLHRPLAGLSRGLDDAEAEADRRASGRRRSRPSATSGPSGTSRRRPRSRPILVAARARRRRAPPGRGAILRA